MGNRSFVFELLNYGRPRTCIEFSWKLWWNSCYESVLEYGQRGQAIRRTFVGLSFCLFLPCFLMKICQTKWAAKVCQTSPFYLGSATAGYLELWCCCCCCSDSTCWSNLGKLRALSSLSLCACLLDYLQSRTSDGWLAGWLTAHTASDWFWIHGSDSRGLGKLGCQATICWLKEELSWRLGTLHIFLGIKLFCLSR